MLRSEEWCEWGLVFDGDCFRATAAGTANPAGDDWVLPFPLVTRFHTDFLFTIDEAPSIEL